MQNILETKIKSFQEALNNIPKSPGCYIYFDKNGVVLYVGKAKILSNRVKSYFLGFSNLEERKQEMIKKAQSVKFYEVDSEVEALILESNLIKKYRPKYNVLLKDDKNYIYVKFEKIRKSNQPIPTRNSVYQDFPRILIVREKKDDGADYFGPYPDSTPARKILRRLRKVFPYRTSDRLVYQKSDNPLEIVTESTTPCFYYHVGLCGCACAGMQSKADYIKNFNNVKKFFKGEKKSMLQNLERKMLEYSKNLEFEKAAQLRDRINDINYVIANVKIDTSVDDVIVDDKMKADRESALKLFIEDLQFPKEKLNLHSNFKIECYDISNIQGTNATGSMVVNVNGQMKNNLYRRFKIKTKDTPDDFHMLQEVLTRRFNQYLKSKNYNKVALDTKIINKAKKWKIDESFSVKPDLLIIDGGKGQLSVVYEILTRLNLHNEIPVVGLAKREEEIFKIKEQFNNKVSLVDNKFTRIKLKYRSESYFLVQRIRDEAHRFAKEYHKKLRNVNFIDPYSKQK